MERKEFIRSCVLLCGAAMVGGALFEGCKKASTTPALSPVNFTLNLSDPANAALNTVGGYIDYNGAIVIRTGSSTYVALSNICTHSGCTVSYQNSQNQIYCPCHGGTYDINGNVTGGPPPSALVKYKTTLNGNSLTVSSS